MLGMGRRKKFPDKCVAAFVAGTFESIQDVLRPEQDRTDFLREAVSEKLERLASSRPRSKKAPEAGK